MIGGLQGENEDLNNKYLKKKSKESVANIRKHSSRFRRHARWAAKFCKLKVSISQPKADFAATELAVSLVQLASNDYNFFISVPIRVPFKKLDS